MFNWLSGFAGILYVVLGIFIIIKKFFVIPLEPTIAYALGGLMSVYGIFRIARAIHIFRNRDED